MRFRILNDEELKALEPELKQFLIVNGVHAEEWQSLNENNPEKAIQLIELFSDFVLEKVFDKINFLQFQTREHFAVYRVDDQLIESFHLKCPSADYDFTEIADVERAMNQITEGIELYKAEKKHNSNRADSVFELVNQGAQVSTLAVWHSFYNFVSTKK